MRLLVFIAIVCSFPYNCFAGYIGKELQYEMNNLGATKDIPVIIHFKSSIKKAFNNDLLKLKNSAFSNKEIVKSVRKRHIESLKLDADNSNKHCKDILRLNNKAIDHDLWLINAVATKVPSHLISTLSLLPQVEHIELDSVVKLTATNIPVVTGPALWNHDLIKVSDLWREGFVGEGIVIASMDAGVDAQHPDLVSSWRGGANSWFDAYAQYDLPHDGHPQSHGTRVMGVMVGGKASGSQVGVAPGAKWISVKIFRDDLTATISAIHAGFQWLLDPDGDPSTDDAPDIVNNSWGLPVKGGCSTEFHADIDALIQSGIEVVFAAGNSGSLESTLNSPADYAAVLSVGAIDQFSAIADFSSRGPSLCSTGFYPNLVAPGVSVYSTDNSLGLGLLLDPYAFDSGTSFAAPHISGVIALLKSAMPVASNTEIRSALYTTAVDLGVPGADNINGYGLADSYSALMALRCPSGTADQDSDGWYDECDNCIEKSNSKQLDTDADGYGNACDVDLNNDGFVNSLDIPEFSRRYIAGDLLVDFNDDGVVNSLDIPVVSRSFFKPPGPSAFIQ